MIVQVVLLGCNIGFYGFILSEKCASF